MTPDLLQTGWADFDSAELRFILLERIGGPGQYDGRDSNPNTFYLPLAGSSCLPLDHVPSFVSKDLPIFSEPRVSPP